VRIPATETESGKIDDFYIGRYEVTNREFKQFLDAGGYGDRNTGSMNLRKMIRLFHGKIS